MDVIFGRGQTIWKFAECAAPDADGWQVCAADPDVIAARVAGLSQGFCLYDEVGHEWSLEKGHFEYHYFPNRFFYSRESRQSKPWMEVWTKREDRLPPEPVKFIKASTDGLPPGEALISWKTAPDNGGGKVLGFDVRYARHQNEFEIPRYLISMAAKPGAEVRMHIQDLAFQPGEEITISIKAVDSAGNVGPLTTKNIRLSSSLHIVNIPKTGLKPFAPSKNLPKAGGLKISVVDLLDKIDPRTGSMTPARPERYKSANHIFSGTKKIVRLQTARNETIHF